MKEYELVKLNEEVSDEVAKLYAHIFASAPWYEVKKCLHCNEPYGRDDDLERFQDGVTCRRCGEPLKLIDYWLGGPALRVYRDAASRIGFVGLGMRCNGKLISFSWGYAVPDQDTPTVWFEQISKMLRVQGLEPLKTFYFAEVGVAPEHQGKGVGTNMMYETFRAAKAAKFKGMTSRTLNPKLVERFEYLFGDDNVKKLFHDPEPVKSERIWYYSPFDKLKGLSSVS